MRVVAVCYLIVWAHSAAAQKAKSGAPSARTGVLPAPLRSALTREGCRVPTPPSDMEGDSTSVIPHVAYHANVRLPGSRDWVVVCERVTRRDVLVFSEPVTPESQPTLQLNIDWDPNEDGCEGWIAIADSQWVRLAIGKERSKSNQARLAPSETKAMHAGILDNMCEGDGATIQYWTGRRWVSLPAYWDEPGATLDSIWTRAQRSGSTLDVIAHQR